MSRPRYYWYGNVKKMILRYDLLDTEHSLQASIFKYAINEALVDTEKLPNGDLRIHSINEVLFRKTKTYDGVAQELHYEVRTIQNWVSSFINLVGKKAGY